jgi:dTDP-D-glucose 4,6-dehydratase
MRQRVRLLQERCVLDVARDIAKIFDMPESKIVHVKDRAFNDQRYFICDKKLAQLGWVEKVRLRLSCPPLAPPRCGLA